MKLISDIAYGNLNEQKLDLYIHDCENYPAFVYFHGGSIENGRFIFSDIVANYIKSV